MSSTLFCMGYGPVPVNANVSLAANGVRSVAAAPSAVASSTGAMVAGSGAAGQSLAVMCLNRAVACVPF